MKFLSLQIENFLSIGSGHVALDDRGLVLIQGENQDDTSADSNGAGKSSIADALCWALYGVTARNVSGDEVINRKAGKGTMVRASFLPDGGGTSRYDVTRYRKHKTGKNSLKIEEIDGAGAVKDLSLGTDKLTQVRLQQLIGCSYEVFRAAVYAGQEQMPDLPAMTDKQLKLLVEEAAGITVLEAAYDEARKRRLDTEQTLLNAERSVENLGERKHDLVRDLAEADNGVKEFETQRLARLDAIKSLMTSKVHAAKGIAATIAARDLAGVERQIADCDAQLAAVEGQVIKDRGLQKTIGIAVQAVTAWKTKLEEVDLALKAAQGELVQVDHRVGCACGECGRPITTAEIGPARRAIEKRIGEMVDRRAIMSKRVEDAVTARQIDRAALDAHRASMTDVSAVASHRASLSVVVREIHHLEGEKRSLVDEAKRLGEEHKTLTTANNPHVARRDALSARIASMEKELTTAGQNVVERRQALEVADSVAKVFGPAGVRAHILDDVTPFLNERTASYLSVLSDGAIVAGWTTLTRTAKKELREKFSIEVTTAKGGTSFAAMSGGEKRKVRIATALALQDLVARRAANPISLFIGDEIDDALDSAGLERLMTILEEKARERGTVFIISHRDLKDWVSQSITVTKKDDQSTITETA